MISCLNHAKSITAIKIGKSFSILKRELIELVALITSPFDSIIISASSHLIIPNNFAAEFSLEYFNPFQFIGSTG